MDVLGIVDVETTNVIIAVVFKLRCAKAEVCIKCIKIYENGKSSYKIKIFSTENIVKHINRLEKNCSVQ